MGAKVIPFQRKLQSYCACGWPCPVSFQVTVVPNGRIESIRFHCPQCNQLLELDVSNPKLVYPES